MKKRIFTLLMAMVMMIGMTQTAFAENLEGTTFYGIYYFESENYSYGGDTVTVYSNDSLSGEYVTDRGDVISWAMENPQGNDYLYFDAKIIINGEVFDGLTGTMDYSPYGYRSFKLSIGGTFENGDTWYFNVNGDAT